MNDSNVESGDEGVLVETTALAAINLMHEKQGVASQLALASLYLLNHQKLYFCIQFFNRMVILQQHRVRF